jgi:hypothetical protein
VPTSPSNNLQTCTLIFKAFAGAGLLQSIALPLDPDGQPILWLLASVHTAQTGNVVLSQDATTYANIPAGPANFPNVLAVVIKSMTPSAPCPVQTFGGATIYCSFDSIADVCVAQFIRGFL